MKDTDRPKLLSRQEALLRKIEPALLAEYCRLQELNGPLDRERMRQTRAWYLKQMEDPPPGD